MRQLLCGVSVIVACVVAPVRAQDAEEESPRPVVVSQARAELDARMHTLTESSSLPPEGRGALEQATRALAAADEARTRGDEATALRAERIAGAALTLAERLDALARERATSQAARARRDERRAKVAAAREALARERARLVELTRENVP